MATKRTRVRTRQTMVSPDGSQFIPVTVKMPVPLFDGLESGVAAHGETDLSKFVRTAVREKLARMGVVVPG